METNYTKEKDGQKISWNKHELDDELSTIRKVTLTKRETIKHPIWAIQSEGNTEGFQETDENDWNTAAQEFRDYIVTYLD